MNKNKETVLSAGIVIVRRDGSKWRYLFLRSYKNWDFPKGLVEPGEDPLAAARREAREEAGIRDLDFAWGNAFRETEPYGGGRKIARYYIAATRQEKIVFSINPELGVPEHHEYRWLTYPEILKLAPPRLHPIIEWAHHVIEDA